MRLVPITGFAVAHPTATTAHTLFFAKVALIGENRTTASPAHYGYGRGDMCLFVQLYKSGGMHGDEPGVELKSFGLISCGPRFGLMQRWVFFRGLVLQLIFKVFFR